MPEKNLRRRSFLTRVAGAGGLLAGGFAATAAGATPRISGYSGRFEARHRVEEAPDAQAAPAAGTTDTDPTDAQNAGRGTRPATTQPAYTGVTDSDQSPGDLANYGRAARAAPAPTGHTDNDPTDRPTYGRGPR